MKNLKGDCTCRTTNLNDKKIQFPLCLRRLSIQYIAIYTYFIIFHILSVCFCQCLLCIWRADCHPYVAAPEKISSSLFYLNLILQILAHHKYLSALPPRRPGRRGAHRPAQGVAGWPSWWKPSALKVLHPPPGASNLPSPRSLATCVWRPHPALGNPRAPTCSRPPGVANPRSSKKAKPDTYCEASANGLMRLWRCPSEMMKLTMSQSFTGEMLECTFFFFTFRWCSTVNFVGKKFQSNQLQRNITIEH